MASYTLAPFPLLFYQAYVTKNPGLVGVPSRAGPSEIGFCLLTPSQVGENSQKIGFQEVG